MKKSAILCAQMADFCRPDHIYKFNDSLVDPQILIHKIHC